ncbi:MAG TPA: branched-chain amino acid ABC transporter permease [Nitrososphaerales archaeon]|nr:branched-chain amino acid ABC transporter permease [Nitrososphaerales archaeon]
MAQSKETNSSEKTKSGSPALKLRMFGLGLFKSSHNNSAWVTLLGLVLAGLVPFFVGASNQNALGQYVIYLVWITLAESWNLLGGYAGLINLGIGAFFSMGCVVSSVLLNLGVSIIPAMLVAGLVGAILALALTPTFRLRSDYFAIGTLVIPFLLKPLVEYFAKKSNFDVPIGIVLNPTLFYYTGLGMCGITIFGILLLMRSRIGMALRGIGDDEYASSALGVNVLMFKTITLVVSGFIASVAGAYYLGIIGAVNTTIFDNLSFSLFPAFMVIIGGIGTFEGPILGAILFSAVSYGAVVYFQGTSFEVLVFSIMIMFVAVVLPKGIIPTLRKYISRRKRKDSSDKN